MRAEHPARPRVRRAPRRARAARSPSAAAATDARKMSSVRIASLKPSPSAPSSASRRHAAAVELEPRERMRRDHVDALGDRQARRVGRHDERRDAARAGRLARAREHAVEVGDAAVRDPRLAAVEHPVAAVAHARASSSPRRRTRRRAPTARTPRSPRPARPPAASARFCASLPASVIAPLPSPCIANAKSARPSW